MRRRTFAAGLGLALAAAAGGIWHFAARRYPRTPYDDILDQLAARDSATVLGGAALRAMPGFDAAKAAARLRQEPKLAEAVAGDIAADRMTEVAGWVLPRSLVLAAALAAKA
jgi:hypothetical protein